MAEKPPRPYGYKIFFGEEMWQNVNKMESRGADTLAKGQLKCSGSYKCFQNDVAEHKKINRISLLSL